jgi:polyvinyl alcohol dehydrogenase (cytochrome)
MRRLLGLATAAVLFVPLGVASVPAQAGASCATTPKAGGDWPMFGQDLSGDRAQPAEHVIDAVKAATLAPAWTFNANAATGGTQNEITGYPIEAGGCVYVGSSTGFQTPGWLFALNADTGDVVWQKPLDHGVYSTLAVADGRAYAFVSRVKTAEPGDGRDNGPYVIAVDASTGETLWETEVDTQGGSDAVSSPIVYDGMVWVGLSGTAAEGDEADRLGFQGNTVLLDAVTGEILKKTYTIPPELWDDSAPCAASEELECPAGGSQWGTIAIDRDAGFGYEGTGNPFNYNHEYERTNAILKIDLRRNSPTFGEIVGSYKGTTEEYYPGLENVSSCDPNDPTYIFTGGFACQRLDLDFGAQPNVFTDSSGRRVVGAGQKSGIYHFVDADSMDGLHATLMGVPSLVGGIVGSAAYDGSNLYVPHTIGGYLASLAKDTGDIRWLAPTLDAVHWGPPVALANGIIYVVDLKGFLDAYDAATGAPLLHRPMELGADTGLDPTFSWGGTTVARGTVYASVGVGLSSASAQIPFPQMPNGFVIAFRPAL